MVFAGDVVHVSTAALQVIETDDLLISPAVVLELHYLYETKRVGTNANAVIEDLRHRVDLHVCDLPFPDVASRALGLSWTRDPFDRLIVAQAAVRDTKLVTKDRVLRKRYSACVW